MKKTRVEEISILHLSDLHLSPIELFKKNSVPRIIKKYWGLFLERKSSDTANWHISNFNEITDSLSSNNSISLQHVVITGDCVTCGMKEEFKNIHSALLDFQNRVFSSGDKLDPNLFSIIPGNHDVSSTQSLVKLLVDLIKLYICKFKNKDRLGKTLIDFGEFKQSYLLFKETFSELFPDDSFSNLEHSIHCNEIPGTNINFVHLLSSTNVPINYFWYNSFGYITGDQKNALSSLDNSKFNILLMHHPPLPPPYISIEEPYLELINGHTFYGSLVDNEIINLIMCGHHHIPYIWDNASLSDNIPINYKRYDIPILCSGASTQKDESGYINIPIYKLQTADKNNTTFKNSNLIVSNCCISKQKMVVREVSYLTPFKLGKGFDCLQKILVNGEGPCTISAKNGKLFIENIRVNDFFCIPFAKPEELNIEWAIHMIPGNDRNITNQNDYLRIEISTLDFNMGVIDSGSTMRIRYSEEPVCYNTTVRTGGYIKIRIIENTSNCLTIKSIEYGKISYL